MGPGQPSEGPVTVLTRSTQVEDLVAKAAQEHPERPAVVSPAGALSYAELDGVAEGVANQLLALGARRGDLVALAAPRSGAMVAGALGILKAGGAYVALDPSYPSDRLAFMLDDCGAKLIVEGSADGLTPAVRSLHKPGSPEGSREDPPAAAEADVAYMIYTSGSTGWPKGVLVEHGSLANLVEWHRDVFAMDASDRCTQIASPGFDAAVWEIWPCLASGASLHIVPDDLRGDPVGLRDWLVAKGITITFLPTAVAESIIRLPWPEVGHLRYLLTGGDALIGRPPPGLGFTVVNNYGLSETTVVATSGVVAPDGEGPPSIGAPIRGVSTKVVDERLRPVEPGQVGELVIGGVAVARGYLNRPELTAERFLDGPQGRRYRTGDLVRLRPDGQFDFLGRSDDQLSVRGFRVEPGEVIAALNSHPAICASVVVGVGSGSSDRQLVAYVVASSGERPDRRELSEFLRGFLPEYLVPSKYLWLDELPLTAHGKVDRAALPAPVETVDDRPGDDRSRSRSRTPTEAALASVLSELLDVGEIGPDENFFLLGGHSMLAAQLIVRLESLFDVEISLRYLFDHPTLAEIAAGVERQMAANTAGSRTR